MKGEFVRAGGVFSHAFLFAIFVILFAKNYPVRLCLLSFRERGIFELAFVLSDNTERAHSNFPVILREVAESSRARL